jgi:hypothetical protein
VTCKIILACISFYGRFELIYLFDQCLDGFHAYLLNINEIEMLFVDVPRYSCYLDVILCLFINCYTILSHDYTLLLGTPRFAKLYKLSSHMPISVNFVIINPCISLGGAPCTNLENKTLLCLNVEKL